MKVRIYIEDRKQAEQNESLGIEADPIYELTDFWVRNELIESFWVDKKDNDIVFGLNGSDYRTPYSDKLFKQFKEIFTSGSTFHSF